MIYNNLIYLIIVIFIFSSTAVPEAPQLAPFTGFSFFFIKAAFFYFLVRYFYRDKKIKEVASYFKAEQKLAIMAIVSVAIDVYFLDCQYYLARLPYASRMPVLISLGGILIYFGYMSIVWAVAKPKYEFLFDRAYSCSAFIGANLSTNLPIVLPWLFVSLFFDGLTLVPFPGFQAFLDSPWGEGLLFLSFFIVLVLTFPWFITRLWKCKPLRPGPIRALIENFCRKEGLKYSEIMVWPLFEGRMVTAGIMGVVKRFRYLLLTPALINNLNGMEIEAVVAHEIGHIRRFHLQFYLFLLLGFGLIAQLFSYLFMYGILRFDFFYELSEKLDKQMDSVLIFASTLALLIFLIFYFRFIFAFFMRNFERQADIHAFSALGGSGPIVSALERVAWLSGNIRNMPSWHHFSIAQRVNFLSACDIDRSLPGRHNRKVYLALFLYLLVVAGSGFTLWKMPDDLLKHAPLEHLAGIYKQRSQEAPVSEKQLWFHLLGNLQQERGLEKEAISAYEKALELDSNQPDSLNNLAWLLLTADNKELRNPERALTLAREAARLKRSGYILDTLARAFFVNGYPASAVKKEKEAVKIDPANREYYEKQIKLFEEEQE
ncbi:MAG: M48 family metalloprotease [Thermodesulfobacteriota bacterium]